MALNVNIRVYDFPAKTANTVASIAFKDSDVDGESLFSRIGEALKVETNKLNLVFCGRIINSDTKLLSTGFRSGHSIHVLYKQTNDDSVLLPDLDRKELHQAMSILHVILCGKHPFWKMRRTVTKLLTDPEKLQTVIDQVPGLKKQLFITDILRHPDLLGHVIDPKNCDRIIEEYKQLGVAILVISKTVNLEAFRNELYQRNDAYSQGVRQPGEAFPFEDEEDMDADPGTPTTSSRARTSRTTGNLITSSQLAQALSLANSPVPGRVFPSPMGSSASSSLQSPQTGQGSSGAASRSGGNVITPDVFSMAMQQALSQQTAPAPTSNPSAVQQPTAMQQLNPQVMERGLEQLRGMGISDEAASREALIAAGGNVETAINILFSSGTAD